MAANVIAWVSDEAGEKWRGPLELLAPPDKVTDRLCFKFPDPQNHPVGFPVRFVEAGDGKAYGVTRIGYKRPALKGYNSHHTIGLSPIFS